MSLLFHSSFCPHYFCKGIALILKFAGIRPALILQTMLLLIVVFPTIVIGQIIPGAAGAPTSFLTFIGTLNSVVDTDPDGRHFGCTHGAPIGFQSIVHLDNSAPLAKEYRIVWKTYHRLKADDSFVEIATGVSIPFTVAANRERNHIWTVSTRTFIAKKDAEMVTVAELESRNVGGLGQAWMKVDPPMLAIYKFTDEPEPAPDDGGPKGGQPGIGK